MIQFRRFHGTADKMVSPNQSKIFAAALAKAGVPHQLVWVEGAGHSFTLQPMQRDLRPMVLDFFNRYLKSSATLSGANTASTVK